MTDRPRKNTEPLGLRLEPPTRSVVGEPPPPTENDDECCRFHFLGGDKTKPHSADPGKDVPTCCTFHYTGGDASAPHSDAPRETRRTP